MRNISFALLAMSAASFATACSGGGAGAGGYVAPVRTPATAQPVSSPQSNTPLQTATIDGAAAFVTASDLPVYVFANDTTDVSNCTGACLAAWPAVVPPAGTLPSPWSSFRRSDNNALQLAYNGQPLYTFSEDSPGISNGNGQEGFSLARPLATTAPSSTPTPDSTATPAPTPPGY